MVQKTAHGWEGNDILTINEQQFEVSTLKRYSGHISTVVHKVIRKESDGCITTEYEGIMNPQMRVDHGSKTATQKNVSECHALGLAAFQAQIDEGKVKVSNKPVAGDIIWLEGYGKGKRSDENSHVVYKVEDNKYFTIEKDTLVLDVKTHVKPISEKFGIGYYYEVGHCVNWDEAKIAEMLVKAKEVKRLKDIQIAKQDEINRKEQEKHEKYLSQFIEADVRKTTAIIKAHLLKTWNVKSSVKTESFSGGTSMDVTYFSPKPIKELEDFIKTFQHGYFNGMEDIYEYSSTEIILDGHILVTYKYVFSHHEKGELIQNPIKSATQKKGVEVIDYSDKAIAVIGDTKPLRAELKAIGGRFNFRLKCGAGWIFPKTKLALVNELIS